MTCVHSSMLFHAGQPHGHLGPTRKCQQWLAHEVGRKHTRDEDAAASINSESTASFHILSDDMGRPPFENTAAQACDALYERTHPLLHPNPNTGTNPDGYQKTKRKPDPHPDRPRPRLKHKPKSKPNVNGLRCWHTNTPSRRPKRSSTLQTNAYHHADATNDASERRKKALR